MDANADTLAQLRESAEIAWGLRWQMSWDMNNDGAVDVADFWLMTKWFFFVPGDGLLLLTMIYATPVAIFLSVNPLSLGGLLSGLISAPLWLIGIGFFARR